MVILLEQACWERFGDALTPSDRSRKPKELAPLAPNPRPAFFTENTADRAVAREFNSDGTETRLYLVLIGDRWWVSGFTMEYSPNFMSNFPDLDEAEQASKLLATAVPRMTQRLHAGEFASVEEVRKAFGAALVGAAALQGEPPE